MIFDLIIRDYHTTKTQFSTRETEALPTHTELAAKELFKNNLCILVVFSSDSSRGKSHT